jgi:hypothetical protein
MSGTPTPKRLSGITTAEGIPIESLPGWDAKRGVFSLGGTRPRATEQSSRKLKVSAKSKLASDKIRRSA